MKIIMKPADFECTLDECPPGLFLSQNKMIGLKTEYSQCEAYCDSGEAFWGGAKTKCEVVKIKVIPLEYEVILTPNEELGEL